MDNKNPATANNSDGAIQGIILRTSASLRGRYAYFPLPRYLPYIDSNDALSLVISDRLTAAPHFPDITILDSIPGNILYQSHNVSPDYFHVYNLLTGAHFHIPSPHPFSYVNAAISLTRKGYFEVFAVCVKEHKNPLIVEDDDDVSPNPLFFFVYSSKREKWLSIDNPSSFLTKDQLLPNRRKPIHVEKNNVFIDLTFSYLIRFTTMRAHIDLLPKPISTREIQNMKLDETSRYGECNGFLHCAKIDPLNKRVEVWRMEALVGVWGVAVIGKKGFLKGKVVALHPRYESLMFMRSEVDDEILLVDIERGSKWAVVGRRGARCGEACSLRGMNDVLEAALEGGERLRSSGCGVSHPHENAEGPEGEIFIVCGKRLDLRMLLMHYT